MKSFQIRSIMKLSINQKLIVAFLLSLIVSGLILLGSSFTFTRSSLNDLTRTSLKNDTRLVIQLIEQADDQVKKGFLTLPEAQEQVKIAILGPRNADGTRPINKRIDLGKSGYFVVYDSAGLEVAHPKLEGKNVWEVEDPKTKAKLVQETIKVAEAGGGFVTYNWGLPEDPEKIATKIIYAEKDPRWGWIVNCGSYLDDYIGDVYTSFYKLAAIFVAILLVGVIIIYFVARQISRPIENITAQMDFLAQGDLSISILEVQTKDETQSLAESTNKMVTSLRGLITMLAGLSNQLANASEHLTASVEQTAQAANQVAASITDVAAGATEQLSAANETSAVVEQMSAAIQQVAANTNQVAVQSEQAADKASSGGKAVEKAVNQMTQIEKTVNTSAQVVAKLGERSKEIGQIVDTISGIAGQTNLLALNAAIEAARAGEQGRGFAVVAEEVRNLAEQSQVAAKKIAELIGEIQGDTDTAVEAMTDGTREVKTGAEMVAAAGAAFREIIEVVTKVSGQVKEISTAIQQMSAGSRQIVDSVKKIDELSKHSASESQNVSAATEEQSAAMEEISSSIQELAKMAEDLQTAVKRFKI
ncbi:MAG TPA: methyl-accepting chemotaxis protein [Methylomusa anaerophila]|uniref:Methyl-accepting chemotaxis protein McpB n=1 Tax=Methylomusa anaerophila TaxID=1930071 RepID=A0A348AGJ5_9FIRM|nr:methyl-accepting chemotaxis protein [Methylomusa anaerophila]BBB90193.1 methyl-accepting chemotaxis protein McpB [Methylomusa anaerophila]HML88081.1 methyl-accepting chemotaxis protein [Methylomusa anaerophila]